MNIVDIVDIKLKIYEFVTTGKITEEEQNNLLSILEMKTRDEYKERAFKRRFKFKPFKNNPNRGTIEIDGEPFRIDIGKSRNTVYGFDGAEYPLKRHQCCFTSKGDIILDGDIIMKLKNSKRIDSTISHEVGHIKFQGVNIHNDPNGELTLYGSDASMSPKTLEQLLDRCITEIYDKLPDRKMRNDPKFKSIIDAYRNIYLAKLKNNPNRNKTLQEFRDEAIAAYKKFDKGGHTNWAEFEADRYAANKTSERDTIKALNEYSKKYLEREFKRQGINPDKESKRQLKYDKYGNPIYIDNNQRKYYEIKQKHANEINKDISDRKQVLKNPELRKYKDIYK